ncbi:MAG: hypothetical protein RMK91_05130 [Pseudanabaenaceae cyanobacterium SKYGB_i_bin29]|nr:hypothetical protein [Pseudanabaenaceae cyanobacterium SKYG29]MDW8421230.1 hypothetical protein [Pseudanabaenaceae cyanobacterium SKYGB_i_bin29]
MYLASLQPLTTAYTYGNVAVDPTAVIAPGVLLQADEGCRITIGAGVCVGMGTIIHAHKGDITIGSGANLGAAVLVVGKVEIGQGSCIGTGATIYNIDIGAGQIIPSGALITQETPSPPSQETTAQEGTPPSEPTPTAQIETEVRQVQQGVSYGQMQLNRLMVKIFPHRQPSS